MLSVSKPLSPDRASWYFKRDDYYLQNTGEWYGSLTSALGVSGEIQREDFTQILNGYAPDGKKLVASAGAKDVVNQDGKVTKHGHRSGIDLTFSAPKSVSILSYGDERVHSAFMNAVKTTLDHIESDLAHTQTKDKTGYVHAEKTNKLLFSLFKHETSRELDPQLHCHCLMANLTKDSKGKIKTVLNDSVFKNKMYLGQFFRNQLSVEVQKLGYSVSVTDRSKGFFEIDGVDKAVISAFSERSKQVQTEVQRLRTLVFKDLPEKNLQTWAKERCESYKNTPDFDVRIGEEFRRLSASSEKVYAHFNDAELAAIATTNSRVAKKDVSREHVLDVIERTCADHNTSMHRIVAASQQQGRDIKKDSHAAPVSEILGLAMSAETDTQSTFSKNKVLTNAMKLGLGKYTYKELDSEYTRQLKKGDIFLLDTVKTKAGMNNVFSTKEMVAVEATVMDMCRQCKGMSTINVSLDLVNAYIQSTDINLKMEVCLAVGEKDPVKGQKKFEKVLSQVGDPAIIEKLQVLRTAYLTHKVEGKGSLINAVDYPELHSVFEKHGYGFTPGQKDALRLITSTKDFFSIIQGDAGTGKSFSMLYAKRLLESQGFEVRGLAPTSKAASGLANSAEIDGSRCGTIDSFLLKFRNSDEKKKKSMFSTGKEVWVVDEAGMCGSKKILELMMMADYAKAKVVFVGDRKQFASIEAGKIFSELQDKSGIDIVVMPDVMRQKTQQTKDIVKAISLKEYDFAFNVLSGYKKVVSDNRADPSLYTVNTVLKLSEPVAGVPIDTELKVSANKNGILSLEYYDEVDSINRTITISLKNLKNKDFDILQAPTVDETKGAYVNMITEETDKNTALQSVAKDYLESVSHGKDCLLITGTNKDKDRLNDIIRPELIMAGVVSEGKEYTTLQPNSKSGLSLIMSDSYKIGQVLIGNEKISFKDAKPYESGTKFEIVGVDIASNTLRVKADESSEEFDVDMMKDHRKYSCFSQVKKTFGVGDQVIFLKNSKVSFLTGKGVGVSNGDVGRINSIDADGNASVTITSGEKPRDISLNIYGIGNKGYTFVNHAYAISDYKSQGATTERLIWYAPTDSGPITSNSFYVAITRCKEEVAVYTNDAKALKESVKVEQEKSSTVGFVTDWRIRGNDVFATVQEFFNKKISPVLISPLSKLLEKTGSFIQEYKDRERFLLDDRNLLEKEKKNKKDISANVEV